MFSRTASEGHVTVEKTRGQSPVSCLWMNLIKSSRTRTASEGHATVGKTRDSTESQGGASLCPGISPCAPLGQKTIVRYLGAKRDAR